MDYRDALASLGYHRHPDFWKSDYELAPPDPAKTGAGRAMTGRVPSPRDREADGETRIASAQDLFELRRRAATSGQRAEWAGADRSAADLILQVGVSGGDQ
jgi:hypothetical protein